MAFLAAGIVSPEGVAPAEAGAKTAAAQKADRIPAKIRRVIVPPIQGFGCLTVRALPVHEHLIEIKTTNIRSGSNVAITGPQCNPNL